MTRDDIIRMADAVGFNWAWISEGQQRLERFYRAAYAAGAAAEREACAKVCEGLPWVSGQPLPSNVEMAEAIRARGTP